MTSGSSAGTDEIDIAQEAAQVQQMGVSIGDAGQDGAVTQFEHPGTGPAQAQRLIAAPDEHDPVALHGESLSHGMRGVGGVDPLSDNHEVRWRTRSAWRGLAGSPRGEQQDGG
jgi:hypothetical protein